VTLPWPLPHSHPSTDLSGNCDGGAPSARQPRAGGHLASIAGFGRAESDPSNRRLVERPPCPSNSSIVTQARTHEWPQKGALRTCTNTTDALFLLRTPQLLLPCNKGAWKSRGAHCGAHCIAQARSVSEPLGGGAEILSPCETDLRCGRWLWIGLPTPSPAPGQPAQCDAWAHQP
jgi:hypothetical protein